MRKMTVERFVASFVVASTMAGALVKNVEASVVPPSSERSTGCQPYGSDRRCFVDPGPEGIPTIEGIVARQARKLLGKENQAKSNARWLLMRR